jgi:UDP-glucose 4-epimerase
MLPRYDREGMHMILVTGGLGFIGLHTARALIDQGEDVVLTQYRVAREPDFIKGEIGVHAFVEQLDVTDADRLAEIGKKFPITKIAHLAVPGMGALSASQDFRTNMFGLINLLEAAETWGVERIGVASSGAVYSGTSDAPQREDVRVPLVGTNPTEAFKKSFEILGGHYADRTGLDFLNLRISSIWGPLYHSMTNLQSRVVHAAFSGNELKAGPRGPNYADDGGDMCYVKDCGRGIALLMTSVDLKHRTYNIGDGRPTTNTQLVNAALKVIPDANLPLAEGHNPHGPGAVNYQDITRIQEDTGYSPEYDIESGVADYLEWLRAGNAE